jgi:hypothetical protein
MGGGGATMIGTTAWPTETLETAATATLSKFERSLFDCATSSVAACSTVAAVAAATSLAAVAL